MSVCISGKGEFGSHNLDAEYVCADCGMVDEASRGAELLALRARVAELEAAQRGARCQATTVDPSTPDRPSCAWCVLPAGHQGMHRAELPQDHSAPATLEWPNEVTE